ncbi:MAG: hypothetical protein RL726_75 [Actinomycetota bacterium]
MNIGHEEITNERTTAMGRKPGLNGLSDAEVRAIIEMGESGATLAEISERTGVSVALVNTILMGAGIKPMRVRRRLRESRIEVLARDRAEHRKQTSPRDARILALALEGATYQEIGLQFGLTRERVRQIIAKHNGKVPLDVRREKRRQERELVEKNEVRVERWLREHPGATVVEIGLALGLTNSDVEKLLGHHIRHLVLVPDDRQGIRYQPVRWTRAEILDAIRRAATVESPLSYARYDEIRVEHCIDGPSAIRILQIFDTWTAACREAGVRHGRRIRSRYTRRWSADEMIDHLASFLLQSATGSLDAYNEWARDGDAPGGQTVRNQFGGWREARTRALLVLRSLWTDH